MPYSGVDNGVDIVALPQALLDVYSLDMQHEAVGITRFVDFAVRQEDLSVAKGQNLVFTRYANITRGGRLVEDVDIGEKNLSASQKSFEVDEFGNAIALTEKLLRLSFDDLLTEASYQLGRDMAVVLDTELRLALTGGLSGTFVYAGLANILFGDNRGAIGAIPNTDFFSIDNVRDAVEVLQTSNAPKFNNDFYVCFAHPHQIARLKRDPEWIAANNYANTRALFTGEVGRFEDTIFISTTLMNNGAAGVGTDGYDATLDGTGADGQDLYKAVLFGDGCLAWGEALPAEMRQKAVTDYGRKQGIAWYALYTFGLLYEDYGVQIVTS